MGLIEGDHFDDRQCLDLLSRSQIGRVALSLGAVPAIVPVRYEMYPHGIVVASSIDQIAKAMEKAIVALQCDGFDEDERKRWTVLAVGPTQRVDSEEAAAMAQCFRTAARDASWSASHFFRLLPEVFSGRWLETI